jgi:predicted NodU family carbamoyl transferase
MKSPTILSFNPGHDGSVVLLRDGQLEFSLEAEKDSGSRHQRASASLLLSALQELECAPDVIAVGGWEEEHCRSSFGLGYYGLGVGPGRPRSIRVAGSEVALFESTHERSHVFCSYGLAPYEQGSPCYALIWEGQTGAFCEIDEQLNIHEFPTVLSYPGYKYGFLYDLADPSKAFGSWNLSAPGKLMALAGYAGCRRPNPEDGEIIDRIVETVRPPLSDKSVFKDSRYFNCGVKSPHFPGLIAAFSDRIFDTFYRFARRNLTKRYPLLIGGGCGLNCEWNTKWKECGLFEGVFVPPVTNDSGSAIGTAIEAQYVLTGKAKLEWSVYSGPEFTVDSEMPMNQKPLNYDALAAELERGRITAWVQGRCELGPRALGNRSLLASPFKYEMRDRLNLIKQREHYRPIAPVCIEEDAEFLFSGNIPSPFMLEFHKVRSRDLQAVTHVDGSARLQTVSERQNPHLYALLVAFRRITGFGVLCNTSLNFPGRGFINRSSDLFRFARETGIEDVVVEGKHFTVA